MLQTYIDITSIIFMYGMFLIGGLGMVALALFIPYQLINYIHKRSKVFLFLFSYARHRKTFLKWRKNQKGTKIRPVSKPQILKEDDNE